MLKILTISSATDDDGYYRSNVYFYSEDHSIVEHSSEKNIRHNCYDRFTLKRTLSDKEANDFLIKWRDHPECDIFKQIERDFKLNQI